jgi:hypothetical protein
MPNDVFVSVHDILKRIDSSMLATSPLLDDYARSYAALCTAKPPRKRRERKPTLAGALKQASKAGAKVSGATVAADGSVSPQFGEANADDANGGTNVNPWDEVLN